MRGSYCCVRELSTFDVCYTALHGNKETLKISHFNCQETYGDSIITHEEDDFITREESCGDEGAQIRGENKATQAKERNSGTI